MIHYKKIPWGKKLSYEFYDLVQKMCKVSETRLFVGQPRLHRVCQKVDIWVCLNQMPATALLASAVYIRLKISINISSDNSE